MTCLSILLYARRDTCACLPHEHTGIVDAVAARTGPLASKLMAENLSHVRAELDLEERSAPRHDLMTALRPFVRRGPAVR
jgi:DNA-binding GntR family transcriptional regulator